MREELKPSLVMFTPGNPLRGDDAIGPLLGERIHSALLKFLESSSLEVDLEWIESIMLLPEHAEDLSRATFALFIDASIRPDLEHGEVLMERMGALSSGSLESPSPINHSVSPEALLHLTHTLYRHSPIAHRLLVGARVFERENLSPPLQKLLTVDPSPHLQILLEELSAHQMDIL